MARGVLKKDMLDPDKVDAALTEAWPHRLPRKDLADRKAAWHFRQFYALRQKALDAVTETNPNGNLGVAVRCQTLMREIDAEWADLNPMPRIPGSVGLQDHLPTGTTENGDGELLGTVLKKRPGAASEKKPDTEGED